MNILSIYWTNVEDILESLAPVKHMLRICAEYVLRYERLGDTSSVFTRFPLTYAKHLQP